MGRPREEHFKKQCYCKKVFTVTKSKLTRKYCSHKCFADNNRGENNSTWKGRYIDKNGYILVLVKNHPSANPNGYVREHRLIMEKHLGRYLLREEVVHHVNHIVDDNRLENLELFSKHAEHMKEEWKRNERRMTRWENNI